MKRKVLVILSNRLAPIEPAKHLEILCDDEGSVLSQRKLSRPPTQPIYDEVWQNEEGRTSFDSTHSFKRRYGHRLQKPKA